MQPVYFYVSFLGFLALSTSYASFLGFLASSTSYNSVLGILGFSRESKYDIKGSKSRSIHEKMLNTVTKKMRFIRVNQAKHSKNGPQKFDKKRAAVTTDEKKSAIYEAPRLVYL